jgi:fructose-1,6-bisphosphatase/inositol monophosphatase family enzyme
VPTSDELIHKLLELGRLVRGALLSARHGRDALGAAGVAKWTSADAIYELDTHVEPVIVDFCEHWGKELPLVLVAEGIGPEGREGKAVFPVGSDERAAKVRVIMDPIDGTRGLMYDKRPAWFLAGIVSNKGDATRLSDITAAVQVELPVSKQTMSDVLWAVRGKGAKGAREEVRGTTFEKSHDLVLRPSRAENIDHGFATVVNFFPGTKELAARLMEAIAAACIGAADHSRAVVFDDQYITTGGQLYELMTGHDRFIADLRPLLYQVRGMPVGMSVHPYDMAAVLIAQEAGIEITDGLGGVLDAPMDVDSSIHWAGYANAALRRRIEPVMLETLKRWLAGDLS